MALGPPLYWLLQCGWCGRVGLALLSFSLLATAALAAWEFADLPERDYFLRRVLFRAATWAEVPVLPTLLLGLACGAGCGVRAIFRVRRTGLRGKCPEDSRYLSSGGEQKVIW